jgi:hypothetical protein
VLSAQEENLPALPDFSVLMLKGKVPAQPGPDRLAEHNAAAALERDRLRSNRKPV